VFGQKWWTVSKYLLATLSNVIPAPAGIQCTLDMLWIPDPRLGGAGKVWNDVGLVYEIVI